MTPCPVCGHDMRDACAPCAERAALVESRRDDLRKRLDERPSLVCAAHRSPDPDCAICRALRGAWRAFTEVAQESRSEAVAGAPFDERDGIAPCDCPTCEFAKEPHVRVWCACGWRLDGSQALATRTLAEAALSEHQRSHEVQPYTGGGGSLL